ncbi:uncharacterized protein LOC119323937 [Triticum dicoccoides]|uniref:uncharacterized protein LOC119323937 n=1 Tax=Triticum dicoccoides TaxID=85692 RepID=UPI0018912393|nr:uncharacterized protein LOC119323937 [Triticum dicoccoides]
MDGDTPHPPPAESKALDDDGLLAKILLRAAKMESETPPLPPLASVSKVFDDDDLLAEILRRVGLPTTLVRAAAVCRLWLHRASRRDLLRRFRERHPRRLLGFYVVEVDCSAAPTVPRFVPVPPQPPELAAVVRRAASSLGAYMREHGAPSSIMDCRNGSLLMTHERHDHDQTRSTLRAHSLLCPQRGSVVFPGFPVPRLRFGSSYTYSRILSKEEGDGVSYFYVSMQSTVDRKHTAYVYMLQDGVWVMHSLTIGQIPPPRPDLEAVLVDNKIYMPAGKSDVVVFDLTASMFSTIQLPQGVEYVARNTILSRADDSAGVYLVHLKELELRIWLHKGDDWLLVHNICLCDKFAGLSMLDGNAFLQIKQVGDNAEYVLLEMMCQCALYLDIKCRTLHTVYEVTNED